MHRRWIAAAFDHHSARQIHRLYLMRFKNDTSLIGAANPQLLFPQKVSGLWPRNRRILPAGYNFLAARVE